MLVAASQPRGFFGPLRGAVFGLSAEGVLCNIMPEKNQQRHDQKGFFIQPMYDMDFMTSTADSSQR
jgi:hypothetical protein